MGMSKLPLAALGVFTAAVALAVLDFYGLASIPSAVLTASRWAAIAALVAHALQKRSLTTWIIVSMVVGAEMQAITYNEFLPVILGPDAIPPYTGYDPSVDPGIENAFSTASYRFGHTMLSPVLQRLKKNGQPIPAGHLPLREAFFNPQAIVDHARDGDVVLCMGAGSIGHVPPRVAELVGATT